MKILLLSDSHGDLKNLQKAVSTYGINADLIVHCGDGTRGEAVWLKENCPNSMVVCVKGNCDFGSDLNSEEILSLENFKILITHGHLHNVKFTLTNLSYYAEEKGCNLVFFGHTHQKTDTTFGNVRLINPGSAGFYQGSCAVVEIVGSNILVNHLNI